MRQRGKIHTFAKCGAMENFKKNSFCILLN